MFDKPIYKSFSKGYFVEAQGHKGTVRELRIFHTVLNTLNNRIVFIPNGSPSTGTIVNYTRIWVNTVDLLELGFYMNEAVKSKFDKCGITIPFPQMDVNLKK